MRVRPILSAFVLPASFLSMHLVSAWLWSMSLWPMTASAAVPPAQRAIFTALDAIGPIDGDEFDPLPVVTAVNLLGALGKEEGLAVLQAYIEAHRPAIDAGERAGLFAVVRVLFEPPEAKTPLDPDACTPRQSAVAAGGCLRPPRLGAPSPPPPEDLRSLRYPFFVLGDVPLSLVHGYALGGLPEPLAAHLHALAAAASWRSTALIPKPADEIRYLFIHYGQWSSESEVGQMVEKQLKRLDAAPAGLATLTVHVRARHKADNERLYPAFRARLDQLIATGLFRLNNNPLEFERPTTGELIVHAQVPAPPSCSRGTMTPIAQSLAVQLTRPGDLRFYRVAKGHEARLVEALTALCGAGTITHASGVVHVAGLDPKTVSARVAQLTAPPGVQYLLDRQEYAPQGGAPGRAAQTNVWALERTPALSSVDVASAHAESGSLDGTPPQIRVTFTREGKARLAALSTELVDEHLAIVFEGELVSVPYVREPITGGEAVISLGAGDPKRLLDDAKAIAAVLSADPLEVELETVSASAACPPPTPAR